MLKGKTKTGFEYEFDEKILKNYELVELLAITRLSCLKSLRCYSVIESMNLRTTLETKKGLLISRRCWLNFKTFSQLRPP